MNLGRSDEDPPHGLGAGLQAKAAGGLGSRGGGALGMHSNHANFFFLPTR